MCRELEYLGKSNTVEGAAKILSAVETEYHQVETELQNIVQGNML
jgi:hypothetical protein